MKCRKPQKTEDDDIEMNNNNVYGTMQQNPSSKGTYNVLKRL